MKAFSYVLALFVASAYADFGAGFGINIGGSQVKLQDEKEYPVPGDNPLLFCTDPDGDILKIKTVDLAPNPPKAGTKLSITATGDLKERVEKGAKIHLQVKYGLITLINQDTDLCDQASNVDVDCPIEKGTLKISKDVDLPQQIPPGKYTVLANVTTEDNRKITCLTSTISFSRG